MKDRINEQTSDNLEMKGEYALILTGLMAGQPHVFVYAPST